MAKNLYIIIPSHLYMSKLTNNPDIKLCLDRYGSSGVSRTVPFIIYELMSVAVHNAGIDVVPLTLSLPINEPELPIDLLGRLHRLADALKFLLISELHRRRAYNAHINPFLHSITHDGLIIYMEPIPGRINSEVYQVDKSP